MRIIRGGVAVEASHVRVGSFIYVVQCDRFCYSTKGTTYQDIVWSSSFDNVGGHIRWLSQRRPYIYLEVITHLRWYKTTLKKYVQILVLQGKLALICAP